jgi:fatty acid desaturase
MHEAVSARLVLTGLLGVALLGAALIGLGGAGWWAAPLIVAQALWIYRLYVVAHEAVHRKLFPAQPRFNDLCARVLLLPIGAPLTIYRKVHAFHHGSNRKDSHHAALDHFHLGGPATPARRAWARVVWTFYVFGGGFYLHSLATILIFLLVPSRAARRIDRVFAGWSARERLRAWVEFGAAVAFHVVVARVAGAAGWAIALGLPLALFAWLWSLLLYVYHYRTSVGPHVRHNVRSLRPHPFFSWLLLNFNEHVTHHADPSLPWYELPRRRTELPPELAANQNVETLLAAIRQQWRGPVLVEPNAGGAP